MPFYNALHHDRTTWYCLPILDIVLVRLSISICCKDSASRAENKIKLYLFDFQSGKIARNFCRIRSEFAPDLFGNCSEFARNSGGNHA